MKQDLRGLIAGALYPTKAYSLPAVCERYGLAPGESDEAFSSKTKYVLRRLEKLPNSEVLAIARKVAEDFPDDALLAAIEQSDCCAFRPIRSRIPSTSGQPFRGIRSFRDDAAERGFLMSPLFVLVNWCDRCAVGAARGAERAP
jgi:hypothetical protein